MRLLIGISLLLAILGLFLLAHASELQQPTRLKISQISRQHESQLIETRGEISSVYFSNGNLNMKICDGECIKVFIFSGDIPQVSSASSNLWLLKKGDSVVVRGTATEYRSQMEITAESVKAI